MAVALFDAAVPGRAVYSAWDSCRRVSAGRGALSFSCRKSGILRSWRTSDRSRVFLSRSGAVKEVFLRNGVAALATRNAFQATGPSSGSLSEFESHLLEKGDEVAQELAKNGMEGTSIFLIGMMGCGKSTVGRIVAHPLNYEFSDSDDVIESYVNGLLVKDIFRQRSEVEFRDLETQALETLSKCKRLVVATGGGAVVRDENWNYLGDGITVWLDVPLEDIAKRITAVGTESRPLLGDQCGTYEDALAKLRGLMEEREECYNRAHCRVSFQALASSLQLIDVGALTPTAIAVQVLEEIKQALVPDDNFATSLRSF